MTGVLTSDSTVGSASNDAPPLARRELEALTSMLRSRFPERGSHEIEQLVAGVHADLAGQARVRSHLIPLTLNRCRRILTQRTRVDGLGG